MSALFFDYSETRLTKTVNLQTGQHNVINKQLKFPHYWRDIKEYFRLLSNKPKSKLKMKKLISLCLLLLCIPSLSQAKVLHVAEHGFVVENKQSIALKKSVVWRALVDNVDQWWPKDHSWWKGKFSIDEFAGGCFCEVNGTQSAEHMRISFVDPHNTLRMTGGLGPLQQMGMHGALDWKFSDDDGQTTVTLTYSVSGIRAEGFSDLAPIVARVQGMQLAALFNYLQSQPGFDE